LWWGLFSCTGFLSTLRWLWIWSIEKRLFLRFLLLLQKGCEL
jgi:hypothetical protein